MGFNSGFKGLKRLLSLTALGKKRKGSKVKGNIYSFFYSALNFIVDKTFVTKRKTGD